MSDAHGAHGEGDASHAPVEDPLRRITYFASTHTRGKREMFGIRAIDRAKHMYVIGKTGMGKSTMLENLAIQDIQNGEGLAFIDPHGSTAEKLLDFIPYDRLKDVVYFAPFDTDNPIGFNVMEDVGYDKRHLVVSGLMGAFKRIWVDSWSARMEYILQNTLLALLEYPGATLLDVNRMMTNKTYRNAVLEVVSDPIVKAFWTEEFANFTDTYTREATPAIQNKIGQFTANPLVRNIVGQPTSTFDLRKIMDEKKIFIVNLSKGRMGESNASLLGSMLTVKIYLAAMSRAGESAARIAKLAPFYFYVDEFQSMMNEAFADILSEARKYKLALTLANQYIEQMEEKVRDAVFGNVGTLIVFRVGPFDAEVLKTVFEPTFTAEDLVGLGLGQIYLTLMIDGVGTAPFSAQTIPPIEAPAITYKEDVITFSRKLFGKPRAEIEQYIADKQREFAMPPKAEKKKDDYRGGGGGSSGGGGGYGRDDRSRSFGGGDRSGPPRDRVYESRSPSAPVTSAPLQPRSETPPQSQPTITPAPTAMPQFQPRPEAVRSAYAAPISASRVEPKPDVSSLRAAIEKARMSSPPPSAPSAPSPSNEARVPSPAETLRAKLASKPRDDRAPTPMPSQAQPPRPVQAPVPAAPRAMPPASVPAPKPSISIPVEKVERAPHHKNDTRDSSRTEPVSGNNRDHDGGQVSNEVLRRILSRD